MKPRERAVRDRLARAATDPARGRAVVDELVDELVQLRVDAPPAAEDDDLLGILTSIIRADPVARPAALAAEVLATAGHRRGSARATAIDAVLVTALDQALRSGKPSRDWAPIANALAELAATRAVPVSPATTRHALASARAEADPSLPALDSLLTILRSQAGPAWRTRIDDWFADLQPAEPLGEAVLFAEERP